MKSEKRKLLISCFWACWSKAMCSLGSLFQTCRPHAHVLSCSARIFAHVPLWIYPFLFEILYFAVTPKLAEGGGIAALGIAGAKAQTLVLTWEDPVRGWKFWGAGDCWRSALEAQQDNLSPDNLSVWWGEVLLLSIIFANPSSTSWCIPSTQAAFTGSLLSGTWVPSPASAWPPQVCALCLCILPYPRSLDASPGSWHQEEFSPRFRRTENLPLIEVGTVGVTSSICF